MDGEKGRRAVRIVRRGERRREEDSSQRARGRPRDASLPERRREEILSTAAEVFAREGYRSTDVQRLADRLGIGKGTIYRYFPSKRELFLAAVDRGMRQLRAEVDAAADRVEDPLEKVTLAVRAYLAYFDAHPEIVELLIQERAEFKDRGKPTYFVHRDANIEEWRELFRGLIARGRVRAVPAARITDVISDLVYGTMFTNFFAGRTKSFEEQAQDILDIVFHGILSGK